jgi:hypothetical protein
MTWRIPVSTQVPVRTTVESAPVQTQIKRYSELFTGSGTLLTIAPPPGKTWILLEIYTQLHTSAVAGNRVLACSMQYPNGGAYYLASTPNVPASKFQTMQMEPGCGAYDYTNDLTNVSLRPIFPVLYTGYFLLFENSGGDASDSTRIDIIYEETNQ